jgi:tripartite-type tricarboxylate transporter receptor subunit TctC
MHQLKRAVTGIFCCFAMACAAAAPAHSEDYPSRPVHLVISYQPGGIVDFAGRVLAQRLSLVLGQPFVVENRPGAGGIVGVDSVAHAAPDGYDLVLADPSIVTNPVLHKTMPFDVFKDLAPISLVGSSPNVLAVTPLLPVKSFAELVAYGNANPGKLNFGSPGIGTTGHLSGEMFKQRLDIDAIHVPYKGAGPAYIDLISGKVQMMFSSITGALPFTAKGSIVPLATTGHVRSPAYPDLPTVEEENLPGFVVDTWLCLLAPAGTPDGVLATLNSAVAKAVQADDLKTSFAKFGIEPRRSNISETASFLRTEYAKWKSVIDDSHISLE